ncbi:MAG: hypothetical protein JWN86_2132 [Planctomycetota bacterium]|nr:hypothetical protein [Planctomycetota bacterium]
MANHRRPAHGTRWTIRGAAAFVGVMAIAFAAIRSESVIALAISTSSTALAILVSFLAGQELRDRRGSFCFGFAVFAGAYFLALTPWQWDLVDTPETPVSISTPLPTIEPLNRLSEILMREDKPAPVAGGQAQQMGAGQTYNTRLSIVCGTVHLAFCWVFGFLGGTIGLLLSRWRGDRDTVEGQA